MKGTGNEKDRARDDVLEELFRHASVRERPPVDAEQAIRASLHEDWRRITNQRRRRRYGLALAAAASVALVVIVAGPLFEGPGVKESGVRVAEVERLKGRAYLHSPGDHVPTELGATSALKTGQLVATAHRAGMAVRWRNGIALRIDQNSRVRMDTPEGILIEAGRIYIDTRSLVDSGSQLEVATPAGPVRHAGTRYMVAVQAGKTSVSVREGRVLLVDSGLAVAAGEKLVASAGSGPRREAVAVHGEAWAWADELSEPVTTDGRSVSELLAWTGRETGRTVEFGSLEAERLAQETRLVGDLAVEPTQVLALISQSTDLLVEVVDGVIKVRLDEKP